MAASGDNSHTPRLMASETANALWRKVRLGKIRRGRSGALMAAVSEMPVHWNADETDCADAVRLALALDSQGLESIGLVHSRSPDNRSTQSASAAVDGPVSGPMPGNRDHLAPGVSPPAPALGWA